MREEKMKRCSYSDVTDTLADGAFRNKSTNVYSKDSSDQRKSTLDHFTAVWTVQTSSYRAVVSLRLYCIIFSFIISMQMTKLVKTSFYFFTHSP